MQAAFVLYVRVVVVPSLVWILASLIGVDANLALACWLALDFGLGLLQRVAYVRRLGLRAALLAEPSEEAEALRRSVAAFATPAGLAAPDRILILDSRPGYENLFTSWPRIRGRRFAAIAVSRRCIDELPPEVLQAGFAHELGHVNRSSRVGRTASELLVMLAPGVAAGAAMLLGTGPETFLACVIVRVLPIFLGRWAQRRDEVMADEVAVRLGAGADLVRLLSWRASIRKRGHALPELLSSHPSDASRAWLLNGEELES